MISAEAVLGLPGYQITGMEERSGEVTTSVRYTGPISCPHCGGQRLRANGLVVERTAVSLTCR